MLNQVSDTGRPAAGRSEIAENGDRHRAGQREKGQVRLNTAQIAAAVVERVIAESGAEAGAEIEFYDDIPIDELPSELQMVAFPVVFELMMNACRHSRSKTVLAGLTLDDKQFCIQVQDWGVGFDPANTEPGKRGLKGVRNLVRWLGGTVEIDSPRGAGTCVIVEIPLSQETADANIAQPRPQPR